MLDNLMLCIIYHMIPSVYSFNATTQLFIGFNQRIFQKTLLHKYECDSESTPNGLQTVFYFFLLSDFAQSLLLSLLFFQAMPWSRKSSQLLNVKMKNKIFFSLVFISFLEMSLDKVLNKYN